MAGGEVAALLGRECRVVDVAGPGHGLRAARVEAAGGRRVGGRRHVTAEHLALLGLGQRRIGDRHGREQRARVRMARVPVELLGGRELHDAAEVHHRDALAHVAHHGEVVGDEDDRQPEIALQVAQQVEDLGLDRDVQGGDGLVGDDQLGLQRDRAGDADALALAAGELVRQPVVVLGVEPDLLHQLLHAALALLLVGQRAVDDERLGDDRADGLARVQRRVRVLEDHLHVPAQRLELRAREGRDVPALEGDRARTSGRAGA